MKKNKKRSVGAKILISCLVVAIVIGLSYLVYYLLRYTFYDEYRNDFAPITYVEGSEFKAMSDSFRPEELAEEYVLAEESDSLKLYYNEVTTHIAVYDKNSGKITYSNPQNISDEDYDNFTYFSKMNSAFILYYYPSDSATAISEMNSYDMCINIESKDGEEAEPQYKVEKIENGIRIIYTVGDLSSETGIVSTYLSKEKYDELFSKFKEYDEKENTKYANSLRNAYAESKTVDGFYELNSGVNKVQARKLEESLILIGWTEADFESQMTASGVDFELPTSFTIPLEYTLVNDKLQVNICTDHITETGDGSLIYMDVLPYFGAVYHTYETGDNAGYIYTIDETATNPVAVEELSDFFIVEYDGTTNKVSVDPAIAGEYSFANFTVYETQVSETGDVSKGNQVYGWNSNQTTNEFVVEEGKDYILEYNGNNLAETFEGSVTFVVKPEKLPVDGYFLVPNGSGSLINLNSPECDGVSDYAEKIYGQDDVLFDTEIRLQETVNSKLPVFGWYDTTSTTFVILSRGESLAELRVTTANDVTCEASSSLTNYNIAYCRYYLRGENEVAMSSTDKFKVWTPEIFDTQITMQYCFLSDEYQEYSGMANYYREYLVANGDLVQSDKTKNENIGLYVDLLGAIKGDASFLGFAYQSVIPLTTFDQAEEIVNAFYSNDVNNLVINYQGWMNDGYYHNTVEDINVIRKLGGKSGLSDFTELVESKGGSVYADMSIQNVSYAAEDFPYTLESSRIYGAGYVAGYGKTSPTTYSNQASLGYLGNLYDVLSPKFLSRYFDSALDEMTNINASGISFRDMGNYLYSDMKKTEIIHREQSKEILLAQLEKTVNVDKDIMLNAPNSYAFAYADDIINVPFGDNNYIFVDQGVPFYEMVIHGYINYSGNAINLSSDTTVDSNVLQCIEYGSSPHFTFTYVPSTEMKYTALNDMYATNYANWIDTATSIYNEVNAVLSKVSDASIVDHEILDDNNSVKKVTYSNGVVIYVNYSDETFTSEDVTVQANDYVVEVAK